jgi:hypothetical protein
MNCKNCNKEINTTYGLKGHRETLSWCSYCGAIYKFYHNSSTRESGGYWLMPTKVKNLNLHVVSVAKHPLPRPLECWNKARELDCGDYIEWHLEKERGNAR